MSTIIMSLCWPLQHMSPTQKAVLISLSDNANDDGVCWPSVTKIALRTCLSDRAVQASIKWLCDVKLMTVRPRTGRSTVYTITPEAYSPPNVVHPEPDSPTPEADAPPPPKEVHHTPEPPAPRTVIEPSSEPSKKRKKESGVFSVDQMLETKPSDLSEETARDYFQSRKKKGPLNATIWKTVLAELDECRAAGIDADKALAEAMTAGWQGFKTEWLVSRLSKVPGAGAKSGKQLSNFRDLPAHTPEMYKGASDEPRF
ncbi:helix-turn-helix domain-containing protein [Pseudomonas syringae]|uniref:Helix-turn-helix domain-containing protein n=1 Tax=Pseudomonas syringae TaxID=317 RepID=A0A085V6P9_PSESX|nr:helix-turn-helix domain-containing protein [Pseudomonas syringae]KFE51112.1 hypothetical protein IV02_13980 [Pseudomonas syringae]